MFFRLTRKFHTLNEDVLKAKTVEENFAIRAFSEFFQVPTVQNKLLAYRFLEFELEVFKFAATKARGLFII